MNFFEKQLLIYLNNQNDWITSIDLASRFGVSIRTIKTTIKSINLSTDYIISSSSKGYKTKDKHEVIRLLENCSECIQPQSQEDRRKYIYQKLLLSNEYISITELASELSISDTTLLNELNRIKPFLVDYDLSFSIKNDKVSIVGFIENRKKMFGKFIYDETKESFLSIEAMSVYLPNFDLSIIKEIIQSSLDKNHYFIDDFSLFNFILHIGVILEKYYQYDIEGGNPNRQSHKNNVLVPFHINSIISEVVSKIQEQYEIVFSSDDMYDLSLLIMTRILPIEGNTNGHLDITEMIGQEAIGLMELIEGKILEAFGINMNQKDFKVRFMLHLHNLITRVKNNIILRNPQKVQIKNTYPFLYDVSIYITDLIMKTLNVQIIEDEISYIALHIGTLIEEMKRSKYSVKALLVHPSYVAQKRHLVSALLNKLEDNLIIQDVVPSHNDVADLDAYDIILSTIPIYDVFQIPTVQISPFFDYKDILLITKNIDLILKDRLKKKIETNLNTLFHKNIFFNNDKDCSQADVIESLTNSLIEYGYTDEEFKTKIYEREALSPSDYMNILFHIQLRCAH